MICISETKLKDNIPFPYILQNYNFIHANSPTNAGVLGIFMKSTILLTELNVVHTESVNGNIQGEAQSVKKCEV